MSRNRTVNSIDAQLGRDDDTWLLRSFSSECVDLVYLDAAFFSGWVPSWFHELAQANWQDGLAAHYLEWIADPLEELHRILKPGGAALLVCEAPVGRYVRVLLDEIFTQQDAGNRMVWSKANCEPAHHHVFYRRKSSEDSHGPLYTVIHGEGQVGQSLVGFSFLQGQLKPHAYSRSATTLRAALPHIPAQ